MNLNELFANNHFHQIIEYLEAKEKISFEDDPLESQLFAASYFRLGEYTKAHDILSNLESSLINDVNYLSIYGATCRRLGNLAKARELFEKALVISPQSQVINNNYSNLLIDVKEYDRAIAILSQIVQDHPSYNDAVENLNRAKYLKNNDIGTTQSAAIPAAPVINSENPLLDPLSLAFTEDEVNQYGRIKDHIKSRSQPNSSNIQSLPTLSSQALVGDYISLAKTALSDKKYEASLDICTKIHKLGVYQEDVYLIASDCFIALKKFHQAEICILTAINLGSPNSTHYINLSTLASIRKDFTLASTYLEKAASLDPSNPNLASVSRNISKLSGQYPESFSFNSNWNSTSIS